MTKVLNRPWMEAGIVFDEDDDDDDENDDVDKKLKSQEPRCRKECR